MGLGFEIIWPGKPDCEQGAMYERENLGQFRLTVLAGAIPACSSFELLHSDHTATVGVQLVSRRWLGSRMVSYIFGHRCLSICGR